MKPPPLELPASRVICSRHGEPFRAEWPRGYPVFAVLAIQRTLENPELQARVNVRPSENKALFSRNVEAVLDEKPACCRMTPEQLLELYRETGLGSPERCALCGEVGDGTVYEARMLADDAPWKDHVCFRCVVYAVKFFAVTS